MDVERYEKLQLYLKNSSYSESVIAINAAVGINENSLENILHRNNFSRVEDVDLLSIDIDSNDYYIFESLQVLRPRVIICEYNPTIPSELDIYPAYDNDIGCSVGALVRIGKEKGYTLVALTYVNVIFVRTDVAHLVTSQYETNIRNLGLSRSLLNVITDYSGRTALVAAKEYFEPYALYMGAPIKDKIFGDMKYLKETSLNVGYNVDLPADAEVKLLVNGKEVVLFDLPSSLKQGGSFSFRLAISPMIQPAAAVATKAETK